MGPDAPKKYADQADGNGSDVDDVAWCWWEVVVFTTSAKSGQQKIRWLGEELWDECTNAVVDGKICYNTHSSCAVRAHLKNKEPPKLNITQNTRLWV